MRALLIIFAVLTAGCAFAGELEMFPGEISGGIIQVAAKAYDTKTIYDYMDGGADHYLNYSCRQLYAAEYDLKGKLAVVELFDMATSPDAFGVLSTDLRGESLPIGQMALYGGNVLRVWQGRYFLKVAGEEDSKSLRDFAVAVGRHFTSGIAETGDLPSIIAFIPGVFQPAKIQYAHTAYDFNSAYYISTDNVLEMNMTTNAVVSQCSINGKPFKLALIQYPAAAARDKALTRITTSYLSRDAAISSGIRTEEIRRGRFTGVMKFDPPRGGSMIALSLDAPSAAACRTIFGILAKSVTPKP